MCHVLIRKGKRGKRGEGTKKFKTIEQKTKIQKLTCTAILRRKTNTKSSTYL